jgi:outer membrane protein assembly factor BamB
MRRLALPVLLLAAVPASGDDWPQFRGPGGRGVSAEKDLPVRWTKSEGLRWKAALPGRGLSNPVVAGGRVYVTACDAPNQERLLVLCFDVKDGRELWRREVRATGGTQCNGTTNMAAPTPATDGRRVFALFATGDLVAFGSDGALLWYRSLVGDYPTIGNNIGIAASIALHGERLLVPMENVGESFAAALDARTGANAWKHARASKICWTTPSVMPREGGADAVFQSGGLISAYDLETGAPRWSLQGSFSTQPSPVAADGLLFAPGGENTAFRPQGASPSPAWSSKGLQSGTPSPTIHDGRVYTINSAGVLVCGNAADGEVLWKHRLEGKKWSSSPLAAGDRLYAISEEGVTTVVRLGEMPETLSVNPVEEVVFASLAAADGAIFIRSDRALIAVGR